MDLTFISLLRILSKMRAVVFGLNRRNARSQHASFPSDAIERGCSIGANHAQNCRLTISGLTTRVAIAHDSG
jgi:hypothetical protein